MSSESRIEIAYRLKADSEREAENLALKVAYEQSVELPDDVLSPDIRERAIGKVVSLKRAAAGSWKAVLRFPEENAGTDFTQLLNILYGNVSLFGGVKITGVNWSALPSRFLTGPQFGIPGVRKQLGEDQRGLSCTALKPVGLTSDELAGICYDFALGGIDIIKDDHGLSNQQKSGFRERVTKCVKAVRKAADKTGHRATYYPNITADGSETLRRYEFAHREGAGGVLLIPHLCSLSIMRELASLKLPLPIMAHPAFSGSYVLSPENGLSPELLYGYLWRLSGADFSIYPNAGGRFSFSEAQCKAINKSCRDTETLPLKPSFPVPGGGVQRQTLPGLLKSYGPDTVFLIGGSLYQHPKGITYASREISELLHADSEN